jgi:hypothetical protein
MVVRSWLVLWIAMVAVALVGAASRASAQRTGQGVQQGVNPNTINPHAGYGVIIPSSASVSVSGSATHTYSFTLSDTSNYSATVTTSILQCSGAVNTCSVSPSSVSLSGGAERPLR